MISKEFSYFRSFKIVLYVTISYIASGDNRKRPSPSQ